MVVVIVTGCGHRDGHSGDGNGDVSFKRLQITTTQRNK